MASIARDKNGNRRILFVAPNGRRPTIRLGKVSQRTADGIKYRVEQLVVALHYKHPVEGDLAKWVANLEPPLARKLAKVGLIAAPAGTVVLTLGEHLTNYFAKRTDVKVSTRTNWRHTKRCLLKFFGADRPLKSFTQGDAVDFERWLKSGESRTHRYAKSEAEEGLAINTIRKRISNAKQFFQDAVSRDILAKNPFVGLKGTVGSNRERDFFVDRASTMKMLDACPDAEWRLIVALARFAGLRCPSEIARLKWEDINWAGQRMLVHAPKDGTSPWQRDAMGSNISGTQAVFGRHMGTNRTGGGLCRPSPTSPPHESWHSTETHHSPGWPRALAQGVSKPPGQSRNRTC